MGFWDSILSALRPSVAWYTPRVTHIGSSQMQEMLAEVSGWSPAQMYRNQPSLRTVTSFLGRSTAHLGLHFYERVSDTDRRRDTDNQAARMLSRPSDVMTSFQLKYALVVDKKLYDVAYWWVLPHKGQIHRIPPAWVEREDTSPFERGKYRVTGPDGTKITIPSDDLLVFGGYDPVDPRVGSAPIRSLKHILIEQVQAAAYRRQVWERGGRVSAVLERPANAPQWSPDAREAFRSDWYAKYTGDGPLAGGTPILEDGMTLNKIDFSAADQQWVEGIKLSLALTASAYHVNPTMVGLLDNANFSNVREFRKMMYGETLGPDLAEFESVINERLLPMLGVEGRYAEFNIAEKLQGNFEEQAQVMQTMVGGPVMTRNEGRARFNLPRVEGGDELITPLNVLIGGQASPTDSAPKSLDAFRRRQWTAVSAKIGAGQPWWDGARWDRELVADGWAPEAAHAANEEFRQAVEAQVSGRVAPLMLTPGGS